MAAQGSRTSDSSSSSRLRPRVSGSILMSKTKPVHANNAYSRNVRAPPWVSICQGNRNCTTTQTDELTNPTQEIASPLTRLGKISENSTHMPGPNENANQPTKPSNPASTSAGSIAPSLALKPYAVSTSDSAMPAVPQRSNGRHPTRSMSSSAITVDTRFTKPTSIVCMNAASSTSIAPAARSKITVA